MHTQHSDIKFQRCTWKWWASDLDTQHNNSTNINIKQCRSNNKTDTEYKSLKVYYSKVMIWIKNNNNTSIKINNVEVITIQTQSTQV